VLGIRRNNICWSNISKVSSIKQWYSETIDEQVLETAEMLSQHQKIIHLLRGEVRSLQLCLSDTIGSAAKEIEQWRQEMIRFKSDREGALEGANMLVSQVDTLIHQKADMVARLQQPQQLNQQLQRHNQQLQQEVATVTDNKRMGWRVALRSKMTILFLTCLHQVC
jgi:dsDNA-specific endonuclease/ATPase MutS2